MVKICIYIKNGMQKEIPDPSEHNVPVSKVSIFA